MYCGSLINDHPVKIRKFLDLLFLGLSAGKRHSLRYGLFCLFLCRETMLTRSQLDPDPEVIGLLKQLNGHLQSMQTNTAPLAGLQDAIILAQNALSLFRMEEG